MTPAAKREAVAHLQTALGMSERRACAVRTSMRYRSCRADDSDLRSRLRELAQQRRRFGYARQHRSASSRSWMKDGGQAALVIGWLEAVVFPAVGKLDSSAITPRHMLDAIRKIQARGAIEMAHRVQKPLQ